MNAINWADLDGMTFCINGRIVVLGFFFYHVKITEVKLNFKKQVSIVLGTYNRLPFLKKTIQTLRQEIETHHLDVEIIVVDGGSQDGSSEWLIQQKDLITIVQHNRGEWRGKKIVRRSWGYFMNLAFKAAQGRFICMLSDDCLVIPGSLKKAVEHFDSLLIGKPRLAALAFYWRNWPEDFQYFVGLTVGRKMFVNHGLYLTSALKEIQWIDEDHFHFYHADGDLCLRLWQAGYEVHDSPNSYIEHYSDANAIVRASNLTQQSKDWNFYLERWKDYLDQSGGYEGGWSYKDYFDETRTAELFRPQQRKDRIKKFIFRVRNKIVRTIGLER